jgi:hypothetical protein
MPVLPLSPIRRDHHGRQRGRPARASAPTSTASCSTNSTSPPPWTATSSCASRRRRPQRPGRAAGQGGGPSGGAALVDQAARGPSRRADPADNHTTIVGNLVDDPELRFTNTGIAVANMRVAVTQRTQQDGQWRDGDTSFPKVNVWRGQAEHLADSLK